MYDCRCYMDFIIVVYCNKLSSCFAKAPKIKYKCAKLSTLALCKSVNKNVKEQSY